MAAILVLNNNAKKLVVDALKEDLTDVFLGKSAADINLDAPYSMEGNIKTASSDGSSRVKKPRINEITTEYRTENALDLDDELRITNFYIKPGTTVNKLVLMNSSRIVKGIITFDTIVPDATKSLYVSEIKINVL